MDQYLEQKKTSSPLPNEAFDLQAIADGDENEFLRFKKLYIGPIAQIVARFSGSTEKTVNHIITETVFCRIWNKVEGLKAAPSIGGFLYKQTMEVLYNYFKDNELTEQADWIESVLNQESVKQALSVLPFVK